MIALLRRTPIVAALAGAMLPWLAGCSCNEAGCDDRATVAIRATDGSVPLTQGTYELHFSGARKGIDDLDLVCTIELAGDGTDGQESFTACSDSHESMHIGVVDQPDAGAITVTIPFPPAVLNVRVTRDGDLVGEEAFYAAPGTGAVNRPNGRGCPPTCEDWSFAMRLSDD